MVVAAPMGNNDDSDPTIEARELSPSEIAELAAELGVAIHDLYDPTLDVIVMAAQVAAPFESAPREVQMAILQILRGVAGKRPRPRA
jgi:hypothetical protein